MARSYISSHVRSYKFDHSGHVFPITSYGEVVYFQSHEKRNQGARRHHEGQSQVRDLCKVVPLLPESVLTHRGIPTAGMHKTGIQCHIIRVDWGPSGPLARSSGKTDARQKHSSLEVSP
jgi:hypothetical protein